MGPSSSEIPGSPVYSSTRSGCFPLREISQGLWYVGRLYVKYALTVFAVLFVLIHTLTTFPILFPIHVTFADGTVSPKSMTRASITSLVNTTKRRVLTVDTLASPHLGHYYLDGFSVLDLP